MVVQYFYNFSDYYLCINVLEALVQYVLWEVVYCISTINLPLNLSWILGA